MPSRLLLVVLLAAVGVSSAGAFRVADQAAWRGRSLQAARCSDPNCAECKFGGSYCVRCKSGFSATSSVDIGLLPCRPASGAVEKCKSGFGLIGGECQKCAKGCARCAGSASNCSACRHGWDLAGSRCKPLEPNPACKDPRCAKCSRGPGGVQLCTECAAGYFAALSTGGVPLRCLRSA